MDWIQGDKFKGIADYCYAPIIRHPGDYDLLENTFSPGNLKEGVSYIYTHTIYVKMLFNILQYLKGEFIVISHNGDVNIDPSFKIPENVIYWYSQNVDQVHYKLKSLPIGLANDRWHKALKKKEKMLIQMRQEKRYKNMVYMNHDITTNPEKREKPYKVLKSKPWVTSHLGVNGKGFEEYINNIYNHSFVICPEGNGIDTHRTWETLYLRSIPIEKRNINNQYYTDLPICFVDDWEEVTEEFLESELTRITNEVWNMKKLTFEYWKTIILNGAN